MVGAWGVATVVPSGALGPCPAGAAPEHEAVKAATASNAAVVAGLLQAGATFKTVLSPKGTKRTPKTLMLLTCKTRIPLGKFGHI
ncbi:hypothetical protein GCM10022419_125710 [Nonomuraea rosea]|uniref:Uncharacterized protein n=1 Tax=Nonomuraea rosea TaxID=638574 RepID=A0ABP6ZWX1_9ACTN